jgi:hypothetical protein
MTGCGPPRNFIRCSPILPAFRKFAAVQPTAWRRLAILPEEWFG